MSLCGLNPQWNHVIECFPSRNSNLETAGSEKPHCIHVGSVLCQLEAMQWAGNLYNGGVSLPSAQCIAGPGSSIPLCDPKWDYSCGEKTEE